MKKLALAGLILSALSVPGAFAQTGITVSVGSGGFYNQGVQWGVSVGSGYPAYQNYPVYQNVPVYQNYPVYQSYPVYQTPVYNVPVYPNLQNYNTGCGQVYRPMRPVYNYGHRRHHCR